MKQRKKSMLKIMGLNQNNSKNLYFFRQYLLIQFINANNMIEISCEAIEYLPEQTNHSIIVNNKGAFSVLYKVRTNNIKAVDARPNTGVIPVGSSVKVSIKRNQDFGDNVKLQFSYIQCQDPITKDNFKQLWTKHQKQQKSKTLPVRILGQTGKQRKTIQKSASMVSNESGGADANLFQSVRVSRNKSMESQGSEYRSQVQKYELLPPIVQVKKQSEQSQKDEIEKALEEKKIQNQNLIYNLKHKQKQVSQASKQLYTKSLPNMVEKCKKLHVPPVMLVVIALLFFVIGYYIGYPKQHSAPMPVSNQPL